MDRNQAAKQQFAEAQARRLFISDVATGVTGAYDKARTLLKENQLVIWGQPPDLLYWLVKDVGPALDQPRAMMRVMLTIDVPIIVEPGRPMGNIKIVGRQEEKQDPDGDQKSAQEPADGADTNDKPTEH